MNVIRPSDPAPPPGSAVDVTVSLIGGTLKPIILFHLFTAGSLRFTDALIQEHRHIAPLYSMVRQRAG
jgi:DNA-binding HxlR family transcriptional regulator